MNVNEFCTCGARLPEGARFCHKCGKPQGELLQPEPETEPAQPPAPATVETPKPALNFAAINMRNPFAVRAASMTAGIAVVLLNLPLPPPANVLWLIMLTVGAGFASVWLYQRRTGAYLTAGNGARLGTMVGLFAFLMVLMIMTLMMLLADTGSLQEGLRKSVEAQNGSAETLQQFEAMMSSPAAFGFLLFFILAFMFFLLTVLGAAGGALGAKVLEKE